MCGMVVEHYEKLRHSVRYNWNDARWIGVQILDVGVYVCVRSS